MLLVEVDKLKIGRTDGHMSSVAGIDTLPAITTDIIQISELPLTLINTQVMRASSTNERFFFSLVMGFQQFDTIIWLLCED